MDSLPIAAQHSPARARTEARRRLDAASDFAIRDGAVSFRQTFETVAAEEPFFTAPQHLVDAAKNLLTLDISDTVAKVVRDNVVVRRRRLNRRQQCTAHHRHSDTQALHKTKLLPSIMTTVPLFVLPLQDFLVVGAWYDGFLCLDAVHKTPDPYTSTPHNAFHKQHSNVLREPEEFLNPIR